MPAGLTSLPVRSSPTHRRVLQRAAAQLAHVHSPAASPSPAVDASMLNRASKAYEASAPQQPRKEGLAKQLFPSSSPSAAKDVRSQLQRPGQSASARTASQSNSAPLHERSANMDTSNRQSQQGGRSLSKTASFASLYDNQDSFKEIEYVDLSSPPQSKTKQTVFLAEDDFSDDDALDLDYQAPKAMPAPLKKPAPREDFAPSQPEAIPWSSSPASHFFPPQPRRTVSGASTESTTTLKRQSSGETDEFDARPAKKAVKRVLPQSFKKSEPEDVGHDIAKTPVSKSKGYWDPSASVLQEQKRQWKNQRQTKKAQPEEDYNDQEIQDIVSGHAAKAQTPISLSAEQEKVLALVVNKSKSCFFTGPAGTGKSVLMRAIIRKLKEKYARDPDRVAVTASTGLAACNIGGVTLHSFSGIGLGKEEVPELVRKVRRNPKAKNRWLRTKCLIIDEVSMVDGELFDKLSQVGRTIRNNGRPWGGIQLIITGDFFQLPPVPDNKDGAKRESKFAFDASTWDTSIDHTIGLTQVFRQKDPEFASMLNEMRLGRISDATEKAFKALSRPLKFDDGVDMAELFPTRAQVESSNNKRLRELDGQVRRFEAADSGDPKIRDRLLANMMAPPNIDLKINAQVMLIKNLDETLVNGSLGKVIAFSDEHTFEMSNADSFDNEMDGAMAKAAKKLKGFSREPDADTSNKGQKWPVVQFMSADGVPRVILCEPEEWKVELPNGEVQAKRTQLPLILAWALSIHKAQGQTLERVTVNLRQVFEKGQAYVALSRATSQHGLQVMGFDKNKVMAHPRVVAFYNKLYSADDAVKRRPTTITSFVNTESFPKGKKDVITIDSDEEAMAAHGY